MIVTEFEFEHFGIITLQDNQKALFSHLIKDREYSIGLKNNGPAYSMINEDTLTNIASAGVIDASHGRGIAWALLSQDAGKHMVRLTREIKKFLDNCAFSRIETTVQGDFVEGHRWAQMLGFKNETPDGMKNYCDGNTHYLYARYKWEQ